MKSVEEVKPVIQKIYRDNVKERPGKISTISIDNLTYRVVVETDDRESLLAEVRRKLIDDFIDKNDKQAKQKIIIALNNFKPLSA